MKTNTYKLIGGPNRDALVNALTQHDMVYFRCQDERTGKNHRFDVWITNLGLLETHVRSTTDAEWMTRGLIVYKDGKAHQEGYGSCHTSYFPAMREGTFYEVPNLEEGSYAYFDAMPDTEIAEHILKTKDRMPKELGRMDDYARTLSRREHLILEAIHVHRLRKAAFPTTVEHEVGFRLKNMRSARR